MANTWTTLLDAVYPVGAVYQSWSSTSPATLFGGTWTQITSRFLYATTSAGTTGGANTHTLTTSEIPSHWHTGVRVNWFDTGGRGVADFGWSDTESNLGVDRTNWTDSTGGGSAHNNMPAYITCYTWRRTAQRISLQTATKFHVNKYVQYPIHFN